MLRSQWSLLSKTIVYSIQHRKQHRHKNLYSTNRPINVCKHPKNNIANTGNQYITTNNKSYSWNVSETCKCVLHTNTNVNTPGNKYPAPKWNTVAVNILTNIFNCSINNEIHKIKYLIFKCYVNCKIYNLLQILFLMHFTCLF
jgi:hypothetical protein